jgi:hypothetical protein
LRWPHALERELKGDQDPDREDDRDEEIALFHFVVVGMKDRLAYRPDPARGEPSPPASGTGS